MCCSILEHLPVDRGQHVGLDGVHGPRRLLGLIKGEGLQRLRGHLVVKLGQHALIGPAKNEFVIQILKVN